jgi:hypothetical protein
MAERTIFLPLGGDIQYTDVAGITAPITYVKNFIPTIDSQLGGKGNLKYVKRLGYQSKMVAGQANYTLSDAMQWTGVLGTGTLPPTASGVIVYTQDLPGTALQLRKWDTSDASLGTFATPDYRCIGIQETLISGIPNLTLNIRKIVSPYNGKLLFYDNVGAVLTEVTDGDFPASTNIGTGAHMDGYYFMAATDGYIYNSDLNSLSSWSANSRIAAQMTPDSLIGVVRLGTGVYALGTSSIEPFVNAGTQGAIGSPLQRIKEGIMKTGVLHGRAIQEISEGMLFVAVEKSGISVRYMKGGDNKKVSKSFIDAALSTYAHQIGNQPTSGGIYYPNGFSDFQIFFSGVMQHKGVEFAVLAIGTKMYAYAPSVDTWIQVETTWGTSKFLSAGGSGQLVVDIKTVGTASPFIPGNIYYTLEGHTTHRGWEDYNGGSGTQMTAVIQTAPLSFGTSNRKQYNWLRIIGDRETVSTPVVVSYSDDFGANFTTAGTIDMSAPTKITRLGSTPNDGRPAERIWKFSNQSDMGCSINGAELGYEVLN